MTHFYLTLLSNGSMNYYPNNKPQCFKTKLSKPLDLTKQDYEVGLVEIQYPCTWYTIPEDSYIRIALAPPGDDHELSHVVNWLSALKDTYDHTKDFFLDCKIPPGMYNNIDDLIKDMNNAIKEKTEYFKFKIQPRTFKTIILKNNGMLTWKDINYEVISLSFPENICHILGFDTTKRHKDGDMINFNWNEWGDYEKELKSKYPSDINRGMYSLFVYSDLVSSQAVGDTHVPLLKTVSIKTKLNTVINQTFDLPHYLAVHKQIFDTIEIDIRDDTGQLIPFTYGKVLIKLHFRLRRSPYFE